LSRPVTPGLPFLPADLNRRQRALLAGLVLLLHGLVAWLVLQWPVKPMAFSEPIVIAAQLVADSTRRLSPPPPLHVEPPRSRHEGQAPRPVADKVAQQRQVVDAPPPVPVLASPKMAQLNEPVVPVAQNRLAPPSQAATTQAAVRSAKDVAGDAPAGSERGRNEPTAHTISPADYQIKPPNDYPADAYDYGESGTVKFEVLIDENGHPEDFSISRSSGSPRLDRQARRNVMRARFKPRTENGQPWKGWLHGQMTFTAPD
jgi:protein TonB